ncbi:MAG: type II toxin-antitoxin system RelB/DinJ family antitoxin [Hydrogenothermaceae bacterium]|nr:type II toxin-antitoxin system RelB/DinJ family antitoxin [Hydrogenothermaceae bacterium]
MGSKIHTTLRVDEENYKEAKEILEKLGLNVSQAFNIFIAMIKEYKGLPFEIKIPSEETLKVIKETQEGKNLIEIGDIEDFKKFLRKEKCIE